MITLPDDLDPECLALCVAINKIPGLTTDLSCCGHGKEPFRIWFKAERVRDLGILARYIDRRYRGFTNWFCQAEFPDGPVVFYLSSGDVKGELAYRQADWLAYEIEGHLAERGTSATLPVSASHSEEWCKRVYGEKDKALFTAAHPDTPSPRERAEDTVDGLLMDMDDRRGFHLDSVDQAPRVALRERWIEIVLAGGTGLHPWWVENPGGA